MARITRPALAPVWALNAPETIGGGNGGIYDPDLDDTHPTGTGGAGKYAKGWEYQDQLSTNNPEKFPEQWYNFWRNQIDTAWKHFGVHSIALWVNDITYQQNALSKQSGVLYLALSANTNVEPSNNANTWEVVAEETAAGLLTRIADYVDPNRTHRSATNPHSLQPSQLYSGAGYTTSEIGNIYDSITNTLNVHAADDVNPHSVSALQAGLLVAANGGTFTGRVDIDEFYLGANAASGIGLHVYPNTTGVYFTGAGGHAANKGLAIRDSGPYYTTDNSTIMHALIHENNLIAVRNQVETLVSVPTADWKIPLSSSLDSFTSSDVQYNYTRSGTLSYTDKVGASQTAATDQPAFEAYGLKRGSGDYLSVEAGLIPVNSLEVTIAWEGDNGLPYCSLVTWGSNDNILSYITNASNHVRNVRIWVGSLTTNQMSALGVIV